MNNKVKRSRKNVSYIELYCSQRNVLGGIQKPFEKARYVVFGVPFDATSSYRTGARFMPAAVREASLNIETYSFRSGTDAENLLLHDAGDVDTPADAEKTLEMCGLVSADIFAAGKVPVAIGGEHTITLGILKGLGKKAQKTAVVSFDAHLDLRGEFLGLPLSHTTFMRRISEEVKPAKIFEVGTRAVCQEELEYAKEAGVEFFSTQQIRREGTQKFAEQLKTKLEAFENVYLSVDMDVLDPAFAPAVQNPEADGISTGDLLDVVCAVCDKRVVGFDVVEVAPVYDQGTSAVAAAKIALEMLCQIDKASEN
ncbi:MAG: agmatinase [Candidatus Bathyarchaeota archaeon]|nr:agmatinase [Candidatus Bathyarchaeota archaeon]